MTLIILIPLYLHQKRHVPPSNVLFKAWFISQSDWIFINYQFNPKALYQFDKIHFNPVIFKISYGRFLEEWTNSLVDECTNDTALLYLLLQIIATHSSP